MSKVVQYISHGEPDTVRLGQELSRHLNAGDIVCLVGDLGAGKTTFVKGLAKGLKIDPARVNSPTFVLMNIYDGKRPLYHFDLYRLENSSEISNIGYEEFLYGDSAGIAVIEWADKLGPLMPKEYVGVTLAHKSPQERLIRITAQGPRYRLLLTRLNRKAGKK